jgi:hypothetical protein
MEQSIPMESMSADELWILHEKLCAILTMKLDAGKHELERRLAQLNGRTGDEQRARRPYPKVHPNIGIRSGPLRLGLGGASNRTGWVHS